jgi:tetratricopeptide (TPR) repeat protein
VRLDPEDADNYERLGLVLILAGKHESALAPLERAAELRTNSVITQVLLGALVRRHDPVRAAQSFALALDAVGTEQLSFEEVEMQAIAFVALGRIDEATATLRNASSIMGPDDHFYKPLYDLLAEPHLKGLDRLLAIWKEIVAERPYATPWGGPATSDTD